MPRLARFLPSWENALLAVVAAVLLILAFPDFEYWFLAWFALVPLMWAVEREKVSIFRSFVLGWIFGMFFGEEYRNRFCDSRFQNINRVLHRHSVQVRARRCRGRCRVGDL